MSDGHWNCAQHEVYIVCKAALLDGTIDDFESLTIYIEIVEHVRFMHGSGATYDFGHRNSNVMATVKISESIKQPTSAASVSLPTSG